MARNAGATREEVEAILARYKESGLTRQEYCRREGVTVYMLDYYQRRLYKLRERESAKNCAPSGRGQREQPQKPQAPITRIARVVIEKPNSTPTAAAGFAMTLSNGRRIEVNGWAFTDQDLSRLIQVAERA